MYGVLSDSSILLKSKQIIRYFDHVAGVCLTQQHGRYQLGTTLLAPLLADQRTINVSLVSHAPSFSSSEKENNILTPHCWRCALRCSGHGNDRWGNWGVPTFFSMQLPPRYRNSQPGIPTLHILFSCDAFYESAKIIINLSLMLRLSRKHSTFDQGAILLDSGL